MKIERLVTPKVLAEAWGISGGQVLAVARREGIDIVSLGYRTKRIREKDVDRLQRALFARAASPRRYRVIG